MNGNDFIEIIERHEDEITNCYIKDLINGDVSVPEEYKNLWVEKFLEE